LRKTSDASQPAVLLDGVSKKFRRGERHDSLRDLIPSIGRRLLGRGRRDAGALDADEFWALRDVSFAVGAGEAVGVIGPNGAGKSTLLKVLTRILKPTSGVCEVRGRAGALIEVAAGFHPDLTGRENVYLQGAIMGMRQADIARTFDEIVAFSGVSEFIDTPVKRYSSGMNARLGFSIAAHLDPDVLLIDEVLSVGDARFQEQCLVRMRALREAGVPLVFVSHNLTAVMDLCTRAIVIDHGRVAFDGEPAAAVQAYRTAQSDGPARDGDGRPSDADIRLRGVRLIDERQRPLQAVKTASSLTIRILYDAVKPVERPHFAVDISRGDGVHCYGTNTRLDRHDWGVVEGAGHIDLVIPRLWLLPGCYSVSVGILDATCARAHDVRFHAYPFSVVSDTCELGLVHLPHTWHAPQPSRAASPSINANEQESAL
jgi:lipopolysaccharide transport system ATP-binding protein